MTVRGRG